MPKVNVNAFGVVNLNFVACVFNSTIINRQYSLFNGLRLIPQDLRALNLEHFALPSKLKFPLKRLKIAI